MGLDSVCVSLITHRSYDQTEKIPLFTDVLKLVDGRAIVYVELKGRCAALADLPCALLARPPYAYAVVLLGVSPESLWLCVWACVHST